MNLNTYYINKEYADLAETGQKFHESYSTSEPFPSGSFKNFFNPEMLDKVLAEFPDLAKEDVIKFDNAKEVKLAGKGEKLFGPETTNFMHYLNSLPFLEFLQALTGIKEPLISDPYYVGGGLHEIKKGGLLKVHADFNKHPKLRLDRRINVLVYLNKDWKEEYGGHFELWDEDMTKAVKKILPEFNTMAIFSTTDFSYHGHPNPLTCPDGRSRKSLALYYYSNGRPKEEVNDGLEKHTTLFRERKGDKMDQDAFAESTGTKIKNFAKEFIPPIIMRGIKGNKKSKRRNY